MVGKQDITTSAYVARPLSRGNCHIISSDPTTDPEIDPISLAHQADVELLTKGIELIERVVANKPFAGMIKHRNFSAPNIDLTDPKTCYKHIIKNLGTQFHPVGTVSMGTALDKRLKVRGVVGVRVVDASVIPLRTSGSILATVYTIAEKAADMIKKDWKL